MVTQPEQPEDESVSQETVEPETESAVTPQAASADADDDIKRFTGKDLTESVGQIIETAKYGILRPAYRFAWRTAENARSATEAFFEGVTGEKRKK